METRAARRCSIRHRSCGQFTQPLLVCSECREPLGAKDVEIVTR